MIFIRSCSIFSGSSFLDRSSRRESRWTWVSTTTPDAMPYAVPRTTFAVFRATPGKVRISSIVRGTTPPNVSKITLLAPMMDFVLLRKKPVGRMSCSSSLGFEQDIRPTGFFRNKTKSIIGASKVILDTFGGVVPRTMEEILTLPGVARKTANVVLGTAYGIASGVVVDTHVIRLSQRLDL